MVPRFAPSTVWFRRLIVALLPARIWPPALLKLPLPPDTVALRSPCPGVVPDGLPANITPLRLLVSVLAATASDLVPSSVPFWLLSVLSAVTLTVWPPIRPALATSVPCTLVVAPPSVPLLVMVEPLTANVFDAVTVPILLTAPPISLADPALIVPAVVTPCAPVAVSVPLIWLLLPVAPSATLAPLRVASPPTTGSAAMARRFPAVAVRLPAAWLPPVRAISRPAARVVLPTLVVVP
ncbi:hypothetical protein LMG9673_04474 [Ralstonia pseudosolanacearum]|nr:hypothetical protein LMG9673_04474 [Ralstonia pseudosolanacearum]